MSVSASRLRPAPEHAGVGVAGATPGSPRRSYPLIAAGLLAALLGALLFATMSAGSDHRRAVLVARRPVAVGAVIGRDDVAVVNMVPARGVAFMAAADKSKVVGRPAAVPLVPGGLLAAGQLGSPARLQDGQAAVGLLLEAGRFPPGLRSGDHVAVVSAPTGQTTLASDTLRLGTGVIEDLAASAANGGVLVRVRMDALISDRVAAEGAARRVALVALPGVGQ